MVRDTEHGLAGTSDAPAWLQRPGDRLAHAIAAAGLERWARLFATLLTVLLLLVDPVSGPALLPVVGLSVFVVVTGLARRDRYVRAADLLAAVALVIAVGPGTPATLPFLVVAVAGPSAQGGVLAGLAAGGTLTVVMVGLGLVEGGVSGLADRGVLPFALLLPMVGVITASAGQLVADRTVRDRLTMQQANRLLSSLHRLAQDLPGGLDVATVARAIVAELDTVPGATAGAVLLRDGDRYVARASTGLPPGPHLEVRPGALDGLLGRRRPLRAEPDLPGSLRAGLGDQPWWRAARLGGTEDQPGAILLVGFPEQEAARTARQRVRSLADDGGLALDNARLFEETQARAATAARRRIAAELHDGVAQSLAHLKLELSLLARSEHHDPTELRRLTGVADGALGELRETIAGLRSASGSELPALVAGHLEAVRSLRGPQLRLAAGPRITLDPARADDALRVVQEAVSNAQRHAAAEHVDVALEADATTVRITVSDDGRGIDPARPGEGGGVGLSSMRERAARLGGELRVAPAASGGTEVDLSFPREPQLPTRTDR
ncbi:MAG: sensor histidine kinase [Nitriliruptoraceae bacterium]